MNDTALEQRLRNAFGASAETMTTILQRPVGRGEGRGDETFRLTVVDSDAPTVRYVEGRRGGRGGRGGRLVAAAAIIVSLIGMAAWFGSDDRQRVTPAAVPADAPMWYRLLRPLLPDGFDRVAVSVAEPVVHFVIFNEQGEWLEVRMARGPIPDDPSGKELPKTIDQDGIWFDQDGYYNLVSAAGLQVQAGCALPAGAECHVAGGGRLTGAAVRQFVSGLANHFPVDQLPSASSGHADGTLLDTGTRILNARLTGETLTHNRIGYRWQHCSSPSGTTPPTRRTRTSDTRHCT